MLHWDLFLTGEAQARVLQRRAGHRRVFHGEGSHSGPDGQRFPRQIQHGQRSHHLAKRGTSADFHLCQSEVNLDPCVSSASDNRHGMFWWAERLQRRRVSLSRPGQVSFPRQPQTQTVQPALPQTRKSAIFFCLFLLPQSVCAVHVEVELFCLSSAPAWRCRWKQTGAAVRISKPATDHRQDHRSATERLDRWNLFWTNDGFSPWT